MLVVADSSPLRYLIVLAHHDLLHVLFGEIWIPYTVLDELTATTTPSVVRDFLKPPPEWIKVREPAPERVEQIDASLDRGERAALALARELGAALVLADDAAARHVARNLGFRITGTVGVLRLAAEKHLIDVRATVQQLKNAGFYIDESLIQSAFGEWL